jgi:hypothetical protein
MRHKPWLPIKHAIVILIVPREVRVFVRPIVVRGCIWRRGERGTAKGRGARHAEDGEDVEGQFGVEVFTRGGGVCVPAGCGCWAEKVEASWQGHWACLGSF